MFREITDPLVDFLKIADSTPKIGAINSSEFVITRDHKPQLLEKEKAQERFWLYLHARDSAQFSISAGLCVGLNAKTPKSMSKTKLACKYSYGRVPALTMNDSYDRVDKKPLMETLSMDTQAGSPKRYVLAVVPDLHSAKSMHQGDTEIVSSLAERHCLTKAGNLIRDKVFTEQFHHEIWTRRHAHFPGLEGQFHDLVSLDDLESILRHSSPDSDRIQLAVEGRYVEKVDFCDSSTLDSDVRPKRFNIRNIEFLLRRGATLVVNAIDEIHEPIGVLAADIERLTHVPTQVNLYATWGQSPGFNVHWDEHEVLVVQIRGHKEWRVYGATIDNPIRSLIDAPRPVMEPLSMLILNDGDMLYIPRGHWHSVHPQSVLTMHLAIGFHTSNGLDLLNSMLDRLGSHPVARSNVPQFRVTNLQIENYAQNLRRALESMIDREFINEFLSRRKRTLKARRYANLSGITYLTSRLLRCETEVRFILHTDTLSIHESTDLGMVSDGVKRFILAKTAMPALRVIAEARACTVNFLLQKLSDTLSLEDIEHIIFEFCDAELISIH